MKYYIIAGEASGDLHGSNLIKEMKQLDVDAVIRCWGGDLMQTAGAQLVKHYKELAFMGFVEVIKNLPAIIANLKFCKADILDFKPDVLILIDYPGFNLRIAKWAKENGIRVIYYISPQVWAWKESRVKLIREVVDKMLVILPFEKAFFENKWNFKVDFVGHPLVQVVNEFRAASTATAGTAKPVVALLPGSRKQEIAKKLPVMLEASRSFPGYEFVIAKASSLEDEFYAPFLSAFNAGSVRNDTYGLLSKATAALVTSGTATLETALFGVPQVVCYKGSYLSYQIARRLVKIRFISLVNLIMGREVVKELIQEELTTENLVSELRQLLNDGDRRQKMLEDYGALKASLQAHGDASKKAASIVVNFTRSTVSSTT